MDHTESINGSFSSILAFSNLAKLQGFSISAHSSLKFFLPLPEFAVLVASEVLQAAEWPPLFVFETGSVGLLCPCDVFASFNTRRRLKGYY